MSSSAIVHANDADFQAQVLEATTPVLVDFWATWCGPCKMIAPLLDDVAEQFAGQVKVVKVDVDSNKASPAQYGVRGIPTLLIFKDGQVVAQKVGALTKTQLVDFVKSAL